MTTLSQNVIKLLKTYGMRSLNAQLMDALLVVASYSIVFELRDLGTDSTLTANVPFIVSAVLVNVLMLSIFGAYKRIWKYSSGYEITLLLNASLASSLVMVPLGLLWGRNLVPLSVVLAGNSACFVGFAAVRYRSRLISGAIWRYRALFFNEYPTHPERVLIIGAGELGQSLAMRLKHRQTDKHYSVVGFVDDDSSKLNMYVEGCRVLGTRHEIIQLVAKHHVDLIVVAIHNIAGHELREILSLCEQTSALIKVVPELFVGMNSSNHFMRPIEPEDLIGRRAIERYEGIDFSTILERRMMITGAAGSIGSELSRQLCQYQPTSLVLVDNNESALHDLYVDLQALNPGLEIVPILLDVTEPDRVKGAFAAHSPQIVFHVAAYKHVPMLEQHPVEAIRNNILGTVNVIQASADAGAERFVLISSDKAVNPSSVMGASKRICELILNCMSKADSKTLFASVRFGNVLGSRGSVVPTFTRQIERGGPITITSPEMTRYFMTLAEAANLIIHAAAITGGNDIFVLRMGESVRILELAERIIRLRGLRPYVDIPVMFTGARPGEKLHEELFYERENPQTTAHPEILKVEPGQIAVEAGWFWVQLEGLAAQVTERPDGAMETLQRFISSVEGIR
jgi:FlaA1/EpsC-like NDP-sugar epimerase